MKEKRIKEVKKEVQRRLALLLEHKSFEEITCNGSMIIFQMSIGLVGRFIGRDDYINEEDFQVFITDKEFYSVEYDKIMEDIFMKEFRLMPSQ